MEKYFINEVLEMDCDDNGYLIVKFVLEGDEENTYRELETDEYYYWVDDNYNDDHLDDAHYDDARWDYD